MTVPVQHSDLSEPLETLMTAQEVARRLRISPSFVYAAARDGRIPAVILGRSIRFSPTAIHRFLERNHLPGR